MEKIEKNEKQIKKIGKKREKNGFKERIPYCGEAKVLRVFQL